MKQNDNRSAMQHGAQKPSWPVYSQGAPVGIPTLAMGLGAFPRRALARRVRGGCFGVLRALTSTGGQAATPGCSGNFPGGMDGPIPGHIWHYALFFRFSRTTQNPDIWARLVLRYVSKGPLGPVLSMLLRPGPPSILPKTNFHYVLLTVPLHHFPYYTTTTAALATPMVSAGLQ